MVQYARADTHYLLYIYDCVRAQLLDFNHGQPGLLKSVWDRSRDISLKVRANLLKHPEVEKLPSNCYKLYSPFPVVPQFLLYSLLPVPSTPCCAEIHETHIHWGIVSGAAKEAEEIFQHPAARCFQAALCLEGQAGQAGRWKHRVGQFCFDHLSDLYFVSKSVWLKALLAALLHVWSCCILFRYVLPTHMMIKISEELPK